MDLLLEFIAVHIATGTNDNRIISCTLRNINVPLTFPSEMINPRAHQRTAIGGSGGLTKKPYMLPGATDFLSKYSGKVLHRKLQLLYL